MFTVVRTSSLRALSREASLSEQRRRALEEAERELETLRGRIERLEGPRAQPSPAAAAPPAPSGRGNPTLEALGRSGRTLEAIIEASPLAIVTLDEAGLVRSWNPAAERMYGWAAEEVLGRPLPSVPEELGEEMERNHAAAIAGHSFTDYETRRRRKDGTLFDVSISTAPLLGDDGRVRGVVAIVADITERRRAEAAIRFQANLLDTVEQAVIATRLDGTITYWNRFAEELYGWRAAEVLGRNIVEVTPSEATREQAGEIMARLKAGGSWTGEFAVRRRDGATFPVTVTDTPIYDEGGRMIGVVGVSSDVTGRMAAEEERARLAAAVEGERRRLKELVANVPGVVWEAWGEPDAASQRIDFVSDYVETMLGYTVEEWLATPNFWLTIVHPEDRELAGAEARKKFDSRKGGTTQFRWVAKDGRVLDVEAQSLIICDARGRPVGMRGVTMDISERKRAEAALRESEERFRALVEQSPFSTQIFAPGGDTVQVNPAWERLWGVKLSDLPGSGYNILEDEQLAEKGIMPYVRRAFEGEATPLPPIAYDPPSGAYAGRPRWVQAFIYPVRDDRGRVREVVLVHEDISERRQAEEALRESEERYRAFVEQSAEPIWRFEFDPPVPVNLPEGEQLERAYEGGYLAECNDAMARAYGFSRAEDLIGVRLAELLPRSAENVEYLLSAIRSGYRITDAESEELDRHGRPRHFLNNLVGFVEGGELRRVWGTQRDITERKLAEGALVESRRLLQAVTDHAPVSIAYCDTEGRYQFVNRGYAERFGTDSASVIGRRIPEVVGEAAYEQFREHVESALAGRRVEFETEIPYQTIGRHVVHADYVPHRGDAGEVRGFVAVIADVTERRAAEREQRFLSDTTTALASSLDYEATLDAVARLAADFIADYCLADLLEEDGRVRRLVAAHRDPVRAAEWREMQRRYPISPDSDHSVARVLRTGRAELFPHMGEEILPGVTPHAGQVEELRRLGVRSAMTVPLVARGRIVGAFSFVSTQPGRSYGERELRLAEELARRAGLAVDNARLYQRAQEANRAKDEFLATLSHELRTPLTPIIGWVHLMSGSEIKQEDLTHGLSVIDKNSQSLSRLIGDLLDMSAILNDKMRIDRAPLSLDSVIRQAAETVRTQAERRGVSVEIEPCGDALEVSGDRTRLAQVFWNLLSNAVKFSRDGGRVRVACERDGRAARVHVEDDGAGIEPEFLPRVFDRFQQADMSTTKQYGGLGIGLALVRSFVEAHGGTVTAASAGAGRGSRFTVSLPLQESRNADSRSRVAEQLQSPPAAHDAPAHRQANSPNPPSATRIQHSAGRVLLVDDAPDTLEMLRVFLGASGYEVTACASAREAIDVAGRGHFDIIVSDIGLPDTDGHELLRRIRREAPHLAGAPALAVTGYAADRDVELAREAGYAAHVAKPFEPAKLAEHIERLLPGDRRPAHGAGDAEGSEP